VKETRRRRSFLFCLFLIESHQFVLLIYNTQRAQEEGNGILKPATISRARELSYGTFLSSK